MTTAGGTDHDEPPAGTYHGHATRRLSNGRCWVDVLTEAGPRIVRVGLAGSARNVLAETPDDGWETPHGRYELLGGHRLWFAPEDPDRVAVPDGTGLRVETPTGPAGDTAAVTLFGRPEPATGLVRVMRLRLLPGAAAFDLVHELHNVGTAPVELAPWAITQLPLGGSVLLPQPPASPGHHVRPNRMLVLWPYTSWEDRRFRPRDGLLTLHADAGPSLKLGYFDDAGWVAYLRDGTLLVRRFAAVSDLPYPDLGCNVETYVGNRYVEVELLGPLRRVEPGGSVALEERWEVRTVTDGGDADLLALAARIAAETTDGAADERRGRRGRRVGVSRGR